MHNAGVKLRDVWKRNQGSESAVQEMRPLTDIRTFGGCPVREHIGNGEQGQKEDPLPFVVDLPRLMLRFLCTYAALVLAKFITECSHGRYTLQHISVQFFVSIFSAYLW